MAELTAKQESFIKMMTGSEELARRGFDLLVKRSDCEQFFDALNAAGLFDPSHNPGPAPATEEGYFYIPYWSALDYLTAVAKLSGEKNDSILANKVLQVVRSVSKWQTPEGSSRSNYHTFRKFAEILGLVPTATITLEDTSLVGLWLKDKFEPRLVTHALLNAVSRLLGSHSAEDWDKAVEVLRQCTIIQRCSESKLTQRKPTSELEYYWLEELLKRHATQFGAKTGKKAAEILLSRVREIYSSEGHKLSSVTYRPAIEDHGQNFRWRAEENWSVEGLRDVVLGWLANDATTGRSFAKNLLTDELEILRRVGIYVVAERWATLQELFVPFVVPLIHDSGHLHELYNLIKQHFVDLKDEERAATVEAIRKIPAPTWSDDPVRSLKRIQLRWLSAISGNGYSPADEWAAELQADGKLGRFSDHPDFGSYMETRVGPGPSQYSVQELIAFAKAGVVVDRLNSFEPGDEWEGPTLEGLVRAVTDAVRNAPEAFLQVLPNFLLAKRPFQHCVISGLQQSWQVKEGENVEVDWNLAWEKLVDFFERLVENPDFWTEQVTETAAFIGNRDWVASAISEFLHAGTRNDERAYPSHLLPRTWSLIQILMENTRPIDQPGDDAMFEAINSTKGKAIEALFGQALRTCRAADQANGSHAEAWAVARPLFETELHKCKNTNYEFSTLAGAYLPNLDYMDREWTRNNVERIFPAKFISNSTCAIVGLAYAPFTRPVYTMLAEQGVLDRALGYELKARNGRERLLERIAAAYLWGEEELESSRFKYIFNTKRVEDLDEITRTLWTARDSDLGGQQKQRVIAFWDRCVTWSQVLAKPPAQLFSSLSTLTCYLPTADGRNRELLEVVAPYVHDGYNADSFFKELVRLVELSPDGVSVVLGKAIETRIPSFDFEDHIKSLLLGLAEKGKKTDAIQYAERLRSLGMQDIFDRLTRSD